mmetsp:Transcript_22150/g.52670  ORF Transcript_22150/g.52670 Transcript_22150/m.52670 type:complete len:298 (+) Transcript_22150:118-1011(+)
MKLLSGVISRFAVAILAGTAIRIDAFAPRSSSSSSLSGRAPVSVSVSSASSGGEASSPLVATLVENLPTVEELRTAPFMKQVQYGSDLTEALTALGEPTDDDDDDDDGSAETLRASLSAQLSHSDGIRGFMVSYLTGSYESSTNEDDGSIDAAAMVASERDPRVLLETLLGLIAEEAADSKEDEELVPLMCMNVVMPIAMITKHQDLALSEASRLTAARGIRLLGGVIGASDSVTANLEALAEVATTEWTDPEAGAETDAPLIRYWKAFFVKWGYEDPQRKDIAAAVTELLSKASQQ